jgi:hypothetical protein
MAPTKNGKVSERRAVPFLLGVQPAVHSSEPQARGVLVFCLGVVNCDVGDTVPGEDQRDSEDDISLSWETGVRASCELRVRSILL